MLSAALDRYPFAYLTAKSLKAAARRWPADATGYMFGYPLPPPGPARVAALRRLKDSERARLAAGHWSASWSRLIGLRAAYMVARIEAYEIRKGALKRAAASFAAAIDGMDVEGAIRASEELGAIRAAIAKAEGRS
jgi:hypothetical protein